MIAMDRAPGLLPPGMFAQAPPTDERLMMGREDIHEQVDKWHSKQGTAAANHPASWGKEATGIAAQIVWQPGPCLMLMLKGVLDLHSGHYNAT